MLLNNLMSQKQNQFLDFRSINALTQDQKQGFSEEISSESVEFSMEH